MNKQKIELPSTYEEAVERKKQVLDKINEYNEALFQELELPYSDEEMKILQEEYQILSEIVIDVIEENEESEHPVFDNGDVKEGKPHLLDQINPLIYFYGLITLLFSNWKIIEIAGLNIFTLLAKKLFPITNELGYYSNFAVWIRMFSMYIILPIAIFGLDFVVRLCFRKNKIEKRFFWYFIIFHALFIIVNFIIMYYTHFTEFYEALINEIGKFK